MTNVEELKKQILPILAVCQENKGDLGIYEEWHDKECARKKLFYAYYSSLFCRILFILENGLQSGSFVTMCDTLLEKYNWFDIREKDLDLFVSGNTYDCEVPDALMFIDGFDDVIRNKRDFREAKCYVTEHGSWSFADVRGSASSTSK